MARDAKPGPARVTTWPKCSRTFDGSKNWLDQTRFLRRTASAWQSTGLSYLHITQYDVMERKGSYLLHKMTQLQYNCKNFQKYTKFALNVYKCCAKNIGWIAFEPRCWRRYFTAVETLCVGGLDILARCDLALALLSVHVPVRGFSYLTEVFLNLTGFSVLFPQL
jgi:hypothetical protein